MSLSVSEQVYKFYMRSIGYISVPMYITSKADTHNNLIPNNQKHHCQSVLNLIKFKLEQSKFKSGMKLRHKLSWVHIRNYVLKLLSHAQLFISSFV